MPSCTAARLSASDESFKVETYRWNILVSMYEATGYNGRQLGIAAKTYAKMIEEDATICLTVSGAMTPVGFGGIFKSLIERGFVDCCNLTRGNDLCTL